MLIELFVFPLFCGALLHLSALPLVAPELSRASADILGPHPIVSLGQHVLLGTVFMCVPPPPPPPSSLYLLSSSSPRLSTPPLLTLLRTRRRFGFANVLAFGRTQLRPGVFFFIRDPSDPAYNPIHEIVSKRTWPQLKKLLVSAGMCEWGFPIRARVRAPGRRVVERG